MAVSPYESTAFRYGCTMTSRPAAWSLSTCATELSTEDGEYRPASTDPAPTAGLTTNSPTGGSKRSDGPIQAVGTTGTPVEARDARYRLSVFQATRPAGLARRGTEPAHATNASRTGG
jgi:hypothetical protein